MAVDYTKLLDGNSLKAIKSYVDNTFLKNYGSNPQSPAATITQPDGSNAVSMRSGATSGRDIGIFRLSDDNAYICNSSDNNYLFATFDTDRTLDFSSADNAAFVVLSDHAGVKMKGNLTVSGTITANGQAVILNDDSRLSNARPASDVYAWAKASTKPSYNLDEVTDGSTRKLDNYLSKSGGTMGGNITLGSGASGQTQVGASLVMGIQNDSYGLLPYSDNWNQIGADGRRWYRAYISNVYGTTIYENGTSLVNKYLGKSDQAADSAKLGGVAASSYATQSWAQGLMTPTAVGQGQTKSNVNGYNGATFTIGTSGYNGIYIFTYGNCFVFLPIYGITANKEYKIAASLVNSAGSYTCKVLTYRYVSSSGTLQIYQKENYIPTGYGCALFKVKLY